MQTRMWNHTNVLDRAAIFGLPGLMNKPFGFPIGTLLTAHAHYRPPAILEYPCLSTKRCFDELLTAALLLKLYANLLEPSANQ